MVMELLGAIGSAGANMADMYGQYAGYKRGKRDFSRYKGQNLEQQRRNSQRVADQRYMMSGQEVSNAQQDANRGLQTELNTAQRNKTRGRRGFMMDMAKRMGGMVLGGAAAASGMRPMPGQSGPEQAIGGGIPPLAGVQNQDELSRLMAYWYGGQSY